MSALMGKHYYMLAHQASIQKQRPSHNPPKNLSQNEIKCLYDLLGNNCVTLATAVVQILHGYNKVWKKQACGVLCYIKDYNQHIYYFRLYNLRSKKTIYEEITLVSLCLEKVSDLLYTYDGTNCKVGINFVDQIEAETFYKYFQEKQADRQKKKTEKLANVSVSAMVDAIQAPSSATIKTPIRSPKSDQKFKSKTLGHKSWRHRNLVIDTPDTSSFVHVVHVAANDGSFVIDDAKKEFFEDVLTNMPMSPEEEIYIRRTVAETDNGLQQIFTKSTYDDDTQGQQMSNDPPEIPPRTYQSIERNNNNRISYQDTSIPSSSYRQTSVNHPQQENTYNTSTDFEQSTAPVVPPRPARRAPDNTQKSVRTSRPPPPPIPTDLDNQTQKSSVPPPPSIFVSEQITDQSSLNSERNPLLNEICNFNSLRLKPSSQRPTISIKPTENKSTLDTQNTIQENIRKLLDIRRKDIMGRDDNADKSESSDDEW